MELDLFKLAEGPLMLLHQSALAIASHFKGGHNIGWDGGVARPGVYYFATTKDGKTLYRGEADNPERALGEYFVEVCKQERVRAYGKRHLHCPICALVFTVVTQQVQALDAVKGIGKMIRSSIEEAKKRREKKDGEGKLADPSVN